VVYPRFYPRIGAQFDGPIRTHDDLGSQPRRESRPETCTERCPMDRRHDDATLVQHRRHARRLAIIEAHYFCRILPLQLAMGEDVRQSTRRVRQASAPMRCSSLAQSKMRLRNADGCMGSAMSFT
jgi:hypothetical protein